MSRYIYKVSNKLYKLPTFQFKFVVLHLWNCLEMQEYVDLSIELFYIWMEFI